MAFSPCEQYLYTAGDEAEIYQWDLKTRRCIARVGDTGAYNTTCLAAGNNLVASGSKMGSVNLYHVTDGKLEKEPFKTLMNLTTSITDLKFNHTSELLAFCSKWKKNAVKIAHIPSYTVYQNWPGVAPGVMKMPFCLGFSARSGFLACGNDEGKCHLFELAHFK